MPARALHGRELRHYPEGSAASHAPLLPFDGNDVTAGDHRLVRHYPCVDEIRPRVRGGITPLLAGCVTRSKRNCSTYCRRPVAAVKSQYQPVWSRCLLFPAHLPLLEQLKTLLCYDQIWMVYWWQKEERWQNK